MEFEALYKRYYREVLHYCNKIFTSNRVVDSIELAKDFTQEAFIAAYKQWDKFEGEYNVKAFLYLVVKNKTFNKLNELKRREKDHKDILRMSNEAELPDYLAMDADVIGFILAEIEKLPPHCSAIVKLYFKGLSSHEIAAKLHINRKTALNQKLKGIGLLKHKLQLRYG